MKFYNLRLRTYPNGEHKVIIYSEPMRAKEYKNYYEEDVPQDPFHLDAYREVNDFAELSKAHRVQTEEEREESRRRNFNRTKQAVFEYARCGFWEYFVTLTFRSDMVDRYDYDECCRKARKWLNNQRTRYAPDLVYLMVPEQHGDGAWHFHALLGNCGKMKFIDSGVKDKTGTTIYNMVKWQYGFTTASKVKDLKRVTRYIGKYITKSLCDITPGRQRYFVSNNIPKYDDSVFLVPLAEQDEFLDNLLESLGKKIAHVSSTRAEASYTQVRYIELQ